MESYLLSSGKPKSSDITVINDFSMSHTLKFFHNTIFQVFKTEIDYIKERLGIIHHSYIIYIMKTLC